MSRQPTTTQLPQEDTVLQTARKQQDPPADPPNSGGSGGSLTRVTVNLTPRSVDALDNAVRKSGDSRTDTINRALQAYDLVLDLLDRSGGRSLLLKYADGETERIYIL
jgi:hypothetical protein